MDEEGGNTCQGVEAFGFNCVWTQWLGGQGQDSWGREPVLSGENGVNSLWTQEYIQRKGEASGQFVVRIR